MAEKQFNMCERKKSYFTEHEANKAVNKYGHPFRTYECPYCFTWHLTTQDKDEYDGESTSKKNS